MEGAGEIFFPLASGMQETSAPYICTSLSLPLETTDAVGLFMYGWGHTRRGTWGKLPSHQPSLFFILQKSLPSGWRSLREGLVHRMLQDPVAAPRRPALLRILSQALGLTSTAVAPAISDSPQAFVTEMEVSTS